MRDPNPGQLIAAADALRPPLPELVFVGGCVTGLLITDSRRRAARNDRWGCDRRDRLRSLGFNEDTSEDAPVCRWIQGGMLLDVMPLDAKIPGFSNPWYRAAMEAPVTKKLGDDLEIRMVTAPYFIATKLEAFRGRGGGDFLGSHDLEDVISVVDGRGNPGAEVRGASADLTEYVRRGIANLLASPGFIDVLPSFLLPATASQSRIGIVLSRLHDLASG
jgi:hypothetical protein